MRTKEFAGQKLIHFFNCGGLHPVEPECQLLFHRAEELFRIETNVTSIHIINIEQITKSLMKDKDIISSYNSIVGNCYKEVKHSLLHQLFQLYFRIQVFSLKKVITDKFKLRNESGKKTKIKKRY